MDERLRKGVGNFQEIKEWKGINSRSCEIMIGGTPTL